MDEMLAPAPVIKPGTQTSLVSTKEFEQTQMVESSGILPEISKHKFSMEVS